MESKTLTKQGYKRVATLTGIIAIALIGVLFLLFRGTLLGYFTFVPALLYLIVIHYLKRRTASE